jgi:serine protease inhibitor
MNIAKSDSTVLNKLVSAYENFGFQLLSQLMMHNANQNLFISPLSIAIALAMTYNGSGGTTKESMARVLGLEELSLEEVNVANHLLLSMVDNFDSQVELEIANSLWIGQAFSLQEDFVQRLKLAYGSEVANLDFSDPGKAAAAINHWVAEKTKKNIQELVAPEILNEDVALVLVNGIYFKGSWTQEFYKHTTVQQNFTLLDGSCQVNMMSQTDYYFYCEQEGFQAISLPYGNEDVSMYIFLPSQSSSLEEFQVMLTAENWQNWMSCFKKIYGIVELPRFKVEYDTSLKNTLTDLGMGVAFTSDANFDRMGVEGLRIGHVVHKAVIEVNEEGSEASAATAVVAPEECSRGYGFSMIVDRPFFHAIRDNRKGALLFMGFVFNPAGG